MPREIGFISAKSPACVPPLAGGERSIVSKYSIATATIFPGAQFNCFRGELHREFSFYSLSLFFSLTFSHWWDLTIRTKATANWRYSDAISATMMICRLMTAREGTVNCFRPIESPIVVFHLALKRVYQYGPNISVKTSIISSCSDMTAAVVTSRK